jgi:mono/diheme cytochrome c family protein
MKARLLAFAAFMVAAGVLTVPGTLPARQGTGQETKVASANDPAPAAPATNRTTAAQPSPAKQEDEDALRLEGEKRFHDNCGRCHQAPHKLSPRMMATAIRHMRVRATITDEDMRVILHYMTQ